MVNPDPDFIIILIVILIIVSFLFFLVFNSRKAPSVSSNDTVKLTCNPGECATNIFTGIKRCLDSETQEIEIDPGIEVCNSRFFCENPKTPFAVQSDQSTNSEGLCQTDVICRCVQNPQCAEHVTAYFQVDNGTIFQPNQTQRVFFKQTSSYTDLAGDFRTDAPFHLPDPDNSFCELSLVSVDRIFPITKVNDPCVYGVLAFVPEDPETFDGTQETPISCVRGKPCPANQIPFFDTRSNEVACIE